jgi:hypothetical protein
MKYKTIILIILLILVLLIILVVQALTKRSTENKAAPNNSEASISIVTTNLPEDFMDVTSPIKLQINTAQSQKLIYSLNPEASTSSIMNTSTKEFVITPKDAWSFNTTYTLKINKSDNPNLDKDYSYTFKTYPYSGI